jgi:DNA repair exonuclease SbcCD ATPase subunit
MIIFKSVTFKNFQAVGNRPITINLNNSPSTMIAGHNGSGKSNVLEALTYGLFGKPLKKVNLGGLINSINKKNLLVTVDFYDKGKEYKVIRGQKPNVLEFYVDNELVDQSAASKDYQTKIEHALGMDYKMFTQMIVLNKEKYVPFLELGAADRRRIVEDILDISVFSYMGEQLKAEQRELSSKVQDSQYEMTRTKDKIQAQRRLIAESESNVDSQITDILKDIDIREGIIAKLQEEKDQIEVDNVSDSLNAELNKLNDMLKKATAATYKLNATIGNEQQIIGFLSNNSSCPTCKQPINEDFRVGQIASHTINITEVTAQKAQYEDGAKLVNTKITDVQSKLKLVQDNNMQVRLIDQNIRTEQNIIDNSKRQAVLLSKKKANTSYVQELFDLEATEKKQEDELNLLLAENDVLTKCKELLKDEAIKAAVVAEYIEFINTRVNEYLNAMEFYINIRLDENFNDKIESVNRDGFTYDNLSTGQKCRVSLAICLALMEVASLKNSVTSNVIMIDEILEPLDTQGVSLFMKLVREKLAHKNVFVITQRSEEFADYFRNQVNFKLVDGFTEIF